MRNISYTNCLLYQVSQAGNGGIWLVEWCDLLRTQLMATFQGQKPDVCQLTADLSKGSPT